jgi:adhesin transport system outer membrane protein
VKQRRNWGAVTGVLLAMTATVAAAQALPEPLVKAAQKAIVSNPEVQSRWRAFTAATAEREAGAAGYKPRLDLNMGVGREEQKHPSAYGPVTGDRYTRTAGEIALSQMLFDGMYTRNELRRLGYAKLVRYYELLETSENMALEAVQAYADVARRSELVDEARANYLEHKATAQQIEDRAAAGVGRRVDVDQASGRLALAESNLLTELSNLHDVSARYLRIMGEKPPVRMPALPAAVRLQGLPASAAEAMQLGLPGSPTINAAYENVRASQWQLESRKSAYWPRVDFRIRDSWGRNADGVLRPNGSTVAEVVMNYNLYRGGSDQAREQQAVELQYQARDLQEKACRDVRQTLAIAYHDVVRLQEQLGYLDTHRLSIDKAMQAYRQQFDIGQRTLLDLLDTQNELFEANRAHVNARYDALVAQARTLASMGRLTAALGVARPEQPSLADAGQDREPLLPPEELCPFDAPELVVVDKAAELPRRAVARPAPAVPVKLNLSADALFDYDKSEVKPEGRKRLDELLAGLKGVEIGSVSVVGHTDWIASDAYNLRLSMRRAEAVKAHLVSQGMAAQKIHAEGRGESEPVASNLTDEGRARNRRVEITVVPLGHKPGVAAPAPVMAPTMTPTR